jgi:hypothetical protein
MDAVRAFADGCLADSWPEDKRLRAITGYIRRFRKTLFFGTATTT